VTSVDPVFDKFFIVRVGVGGLLVIRVGKFGLEGFEVCATPSFSLIA